MKNYNKILEAVNRGIQLALDDFDDEEQVQNVKSKQINHRDYTKEYLDLMNEAVDLGLPSGTKWFKYNLGVDYKKLNINSENSVPEDWYGNYYAWGETEPNKLKYTQSNYKWNNKQITTRYNNTDNLEELLPEDDAAQQFNKMLRIPTVDECLELLNNTNKECVYDYNGIKGLNGYIISNRKDSRKYIFIPAAGLMSGSKRIQNEDAILYTNERFDGIKCRILIFEESNRYIDAYSKLPVAEGYIKSMQRICGFTIRPVINL